MTKRTIYSNEFSGVYDFTTLPGEGSFQNISGVLRATVPPGVSADWFSFIPRQCALAEQPIVIIEEDLEITLEYDIFSIASPGSDALGMVGLRLNDTNFLGWQFSINTLGAVHVDSNSWIRPTPISNPVGKKVRIVISQASPGSENNEHQVTYQYYNGSSWVEHYTSSLRFLPNSFFVAAKHYSSRPGISIEIDNVLIEGDNFDVSLDNIYDNDFESNQSLSIIPGVGTVEESGGSLNLNVPSGTPAGWLQTSPSRQGILAYADIPYSLNDRVVWYDIKVKSLDETSPEGEGFVILRKDDNDFMAFSFTTNPTLFVTRSSNGVWSFLSTKSISYPADIRFVLNRPTPGNPNQNQQVFVLWKNSRGGWEQLHQETIEYEPGQVAFVPKTYSNNPESNFKIESVSVKSSNLNKNLRIIYDDHFDDESKGFVELSGSGTIEEPLGTNCVMTLEGQVLGRWSNSSARECVLAKKNIVINSDTKKVYAFCDFDASQASTGPEFRFCLYKDDLNYVYWSNYSISSGEFDIKIPIVVQNGVYTNVNLNSTPINDGQRQIVFDYETNTATFLYWSGSGWVDFGTSSPLSFQPDSIAWAWVGESSSGVKSFSLDRVYAYIEAEDNNAPVISGENPQPSSENIDNNTQISFTVTDPGDYALGVNGANDQVFLDEGIGSFVLVWENGAPANGYNVSRSVNGNGFDYIITPSQPLKEGAVVRVRVVSDDLNLTPNTLDTTYQFSIGKEEVVEVVFSGDDLKVLRHHPDTYSKVSTSNNYKDCKALSDALCFAEEQITQYVDNQTLENADEYGLSIQSENRRIAKAPGLDRQRFVDLVRAVNSSKHGTMNAIKNVIDAYFGVDSDVYDVQNNGGFTIPNNEVWVRVNRSIQDENSLYIEVDPTFEDGNPTISGIIGPVVIDNSGIESKHNDYLGGSFDIYLLQVFKKVAPGGVTFKEIQ